MIIIIHTKANKEGGKGEGQPATQEQDLEFKTTVRLPRKSRRHLKLGENQCIK